MLSKNFCSRTLSYIIQHQSFFNQSSSNPFATNLHPLNQSFIQYLDSSNHQLKFYNEKTQPQIRVSVPKLYNAKIDEKMENRFKKQWQGKVLTFDIDPSPLIGKKRQIIKGYLQENVYKNASKPVQLFSQNNPTFCVEIQEQHLDPQFFIMSDPQLLNNANRSDEEMQDKVINLYEQDQGRFSRRLSQQFNIDKKYHKLIQYAFMSECQIYFCGINAYIFRNLLASMFSVSQMKQLFMQCLNYTLFKSGSFEDLTLHSRNAIYAQNYHILQKIENGAIMESLQLISDDIVFFGGQYTVQSLTDSYEIFKKSNKKIDQSPDAQKIQKHAILEVLLGNLWNKPYTLNKFQYLSENYANLSEEDRETIKQLYHQNIVKYTGASKAFFIKNSRKI